MERHDEVIRASEIGEYVHCHRAWWLGRVQGVENANIARMEAGTQRHHAHGQRVWRARMMQSAAVVLFLIAIGAVVWLALRVLGLL